MYYYYLGIMFGLYTFGFLSLCVWWVIFWVLVIVTEKIFCLILFAEIVFMWILIVYLIGCVDMYVFIKFLFIKYESVNIRFVLLIKFFMWYIRMFCLCIGRDIWLVRKGVISFDLEFGGCFCELYFFVFFSCKIIFKLIWF